MYNRFSYDFWSVFFDGINFLKKQITDELIETGMGLNDMSMVTYVYTGDSEGMTLVGMLLWSELK